MSVGLPLAQSELGNDFSILEVLIGVSSLNHSLNELTLFLPVICCGYLFTGYILKLLRDMLKQVLRRDDDLVLLIFTHSGLPHKSSDVSIRINQFPLLNVLLIAL